MAEFAFGNVIEVFNFNFDGQKVEVTKFHPWKRGDSGQVLTGSPNPDELGFYCETLRGQSFEYLDHLLLAWIAHKNIGAFQQGLVAGVARALCVGESLR